MLELLTIPSITAVEDTYEGFRRWVIQNKDISQVVGTASPRYPQTILKSYVSVTNLTSTHSMYGSSYLSQATYDSYYQTLLLHGLPTRALYDEIFGQSRNSLLKVIDVGSVPSYASVTRNGYTSRSYTRYLGVEVVDVVYWDETEKMAKRWSPSTGSDIEKFDFILK